MKIKVYKVTRDYSSSFCVYQSISNLFDTEMGDDIGEVGDSLHIEVIEMEEEEFNSMPEFEGW